MLLLFCTTILELLRGMPTGRCNRDVLANMAEIVDLPLKAFETFDNLIIPLYAKAIGS